MKKIYRYEVPLVAQTTEVKMRGPVLGQQLEYWSGHPGVEPQIVFWGIYDEDAPEVTRTFLAAGTGHLVPDNARYVGTAPRGSDDLVWHLLELEAPKVPEDVANHVEITEIKIYHDAFERIEDSVSINGSWASNADYDELMNLSERIRVLSLDHKTRFDQERKDKFHG